MLQITWFKKLRQLNPKLKVCQFEQSTHLPGIYYIHEREGIVDICATDIGWVPPYPEADHTGHIIKAGYRRVIFILLHMKLTTPAKVRKVFPGFFEQRRPTPTGTQINSTHRQWSQMMVEERKRRNILGEAKEVEVSDPIADRMKNMQMENFNRKSNAALSGDQFLELAEDVKAQMTPDQLRSLDEAKFNYDRAVGRRRSYI